VYASVKIDVKFSEVCLLDRTFLSTQGLSALKSSNDANIKQKQQAVIFHIHVQSSLSLQNLM
jgi:hypothetical protein